MDKFYYFGCINDTGHYMHGKYGKDDKVTYNNPWGTKVDGGLCPERQLQGHALIHHKDGWTALAFWDRSVDTRPGSNSNFLAEGTYTFAEMMSLARQHFPNVLDRLSFPITLS